MPRRCMGLYIGVQKGLMGEAHGLHYLLSGHWECSRLGVGEVGHTWLLYAFYGAHISTYTEEVEWD